MWEKRGGEHAGKINGGNPGVLWWKEACRPASGGRRWYSMESGKVKGDDNKDGVGRKQNFPFPEIPCMSSLYFHIVHITPIQ